MPLSPSCQGPILSAAFLHSGSTHPAPGLPAVRWMGWRSGPSWRTSVSCVVTQRELPPPHTLHLAWGPGAGAGVSFLEASSFFQPALQLALWPAQQSYAQATLCLDIALDLAETPSPAGAVCLRGHCMRRLTQALLRQEKTGPPSPGHGALPAKPRAPLFMRGRLEQAPQAGRGR